MIEPAAAVTLPHHLVVMGVCGVGKSSVGRALSQALALEYVEGDELHPARNIALMAAGTPLTDADRAGWLGAIADRLGAAQASGRGLVVSCSALRRSYRDRLRAACPGLRLVYLHGPAELLRQRLQARSDHYMPVSLLDSQLATLEPPDPDEAALSFDVSPPTDQLVAATLAQLQALPR